jgi:3-hydroxyacyl-[acyl-carrier-protein] dehydratase
MLKSVGLMTNEEIISKFTQSRSYLLTNKSQWKRVEGHFTFDENLDFYKGHFEHHPVTPVLS